MTLQSAQILEDNLVKQLVKLKLGDVAISGEAVLLNKLKQQNFLIKCKERVTFWKTYLLLH